MEKQLEVVRPEAIGVPTKAILDFINEVESQEIPMHSFVMIRNDKIFAEGYWKPFHVDYMHRMYSISKSVTSMAIGLLESEGKLHLDDCIMKYFPDKLPAEGVHPYIQKITIRDMLKMATAHRMTTYKKMKIDDWVKTYFAVEPTHEPGAVFSYDTSATHTLAALVQRLSGTSLLEYLRPRLLDPIGFSKEAVWLSCPMGINQGGSGLICKTRDIAKFALTLLNEGCFQGKQLLPKEYVKQAISKQIDTSMQPVIEERQGYGYQIWRCTHNGFVCYGLGGQLAICLPDKKFVLVTTADTQGYPTGTPGIFEVFWKTVYPYLSEGVLEENEEEYMALHNKLEQLRMAPIKGSAISSWKKEVQDKTYILGTNSINLKEITLGFEESQSVGSIVYKRDDQEYKISFGIGKCLEGSLEELHLDMIASGAWVEEDTLRVRIQIIDEFFASIHMMIHFEADTITMVLKQAGEGLANLYEGFVSGYKK